MSAFEHLEILVEEPSMEAFLDELLPRVLGDSLAFAIHRFNGKADLLKKLPSRLRGYKRWLPPKWGLMVLVDQDSENCIELKEKLERIARQAGFLTRSAAEEQPYNITHRIVVQELESWYFGDWTAVKKAYPRVSPNTANRARYRAPDQIRHAWEAFERILQKKSYFLGGLQKIAAAREVSKCMTPERNRSHSFQVFYRTLLELKPADSSRSVSEVLHPPGVTPDSEGF